MHSARSSTIVDGPEAISQVSLPSACSRGISFNLSAPSSAAAYALPAPKQKACSTSESSGTRYGTHCSGSRTAAAARLAEAALFAASTEDAADLEASGGRAAVSVLA